VVWVLLKAAQRGDIELQAGGNGDVESEPGHRDGTQDVPVAECKDAAAGSFAKADELEGSRIDLSWGLSAGAPVFEYLPARLLFVNLFGGDPFVVAVIEFAKQWRQSRVGEAGDLGGAQGALERAREDGVEAQPTQPRAQGPSLRFALGGEGDVGDARVLAGEAPFGLAVPGEIDVERQAGLPIISGRPERSERLALSMTAPARTRWPGRMHTSPTAA